MKHVLCTIVAIFVLGYSITAQVHGLSKDILNVEATSKNQELFIKWAGNESDPGYWEVQGSSDSKSFTTIGMVLGTDPGNINTYTFRQKLKKVKPGLIYFRVLHIKNAVADESNIIQSVK